MDHVTINDSLTIPLEELSFTTSRSSGPGGQKVNKTSTRVTLLFDVEHSQSLNATQRSLIRYRLHGRINAEGVLRVTAQRERSQASNRDLALSRFAELLREALSTAPPREATQPSVTSRETRLAEKRARSLVKRERTETKLLRLERQSDEDAG